MIMPREGTQSFRRRIQNKVTELSESGSRWDTLLSVTMKKVLNTPVEVFLRKKFITPWKDEKKPSEEQ